MRSIFSICILVLFVCSSTILAVQATDLSQVADKLVAIRVNRGDVLFEDEYFRLKEQFENLRRQSEGRILTNGEAEEAAVLISSLNELERVSELVLPRLQTVLSVRERALDLAARDYAPGLFREADEELQKLARKTATGASGNFQRETDQLIARYRQAEYQAIRNKLLSEVRILLQESKDLDAEKLTPLTYQRVLVLMDEVERGLRNSNLADPTLTEKAELLSGESKHLLELARTARKIDRDDAAFELYVLQIEEALTRLAEIINYVPQFQDGISPVVHNLELSLENMQQENRELRTEVKRLSDSLQTMKKELRQARGTIAERESVIRRVKNLKATLAASSVKVSVVDNQLILQLNGIQFQPGKILVEAPDQAVLENIGRALRDFHSAPVLIRLKQGSGGNVEYARSLANQRAKAVALIVQTAGFIDDGRLTVEGLIDPKKNAGGHAVVDFLVALGN